MLVFGLMPASSVYAKKKPKLNKTKVTISVNKTFKLKVKNIKGKIKWSSSNKRVVTVSKKGLIRAKKVGKSVVIAKIKKKKLKCNVIVVGTKNLQNANTGNNTSNNNSGDNSGNNGNSGNSGNSGGSDNTEVKSITVKGKVYTKSGSIVKDTEFEVFVGNSYEDYENDSVEDFYTDENGEYEISIKSNTLYSIVPEGEYRDEVAQIKLSESNNNYNLRVKMSYVYGTINQKGVTSIDLTEYDVNFRPDIDGDDILPVNNRTSWSEDNSYKVLVPYGKYTVDIINYSQKLGTVTVAESDLKTDFTCATYVLEGTLSVNNEPIPDNTWIRCYTKGYRNYCSCSVSSDGHYRMIMPATGEYTVVLGEYDDDWIDEELGKVTIEDSSVVQRKDFNYSYNKKYEVNGLIYTESGELIKDTYFHLVLASEYDGNEEDYNYSSDYGFWTDEEGKYDFRAEMNAEYVILNHANENREVGRVTFDSENLNKNIYLKMGIVYGTVKINSSTGFNKSSVELFVKDEDDGYSSVASSNVNSDGSYKVFAPYGSYSIGASLEGYFKTLGNVTVTKNSVKKDYDVQLYMIEGTLMINGSNNVPNDTEIQCIAEEGQGIDYYSYANVGSNGHYRLFFDKPGVYKVKLYRYKDEWLDKELGSVTINKDTPVQTENFSINITLLEKSIEKDQVITFKPEQYSVLKLKFNTDETSLYEISAYCNEGYHTLNYSVDGSNRTDSLYEGEWSKAGYRDVYSKEREYTITFIFDGEDYYGKTFKIKMIGSNVEINNVKINQEVDVKIDLYNDPEWNRMRYFSFVAEEDGYYKIQGSVNETDDYSWLSMQGTNGSIGYENINNEWKPYWDDEYSSKIYLEKGEVTIIELYCNSDVMDTIFSVVKA